MKTAGSLAVLVALWGACGDDSGAAAPDSAIPVDARVADASATPCDPFSNQGCAPGQKCTALQRGANLVLACGSKGGQTQGTSCTPTASGDNCADGLACFALLGETTPTCRQFCQASASGMCPAGTGCGLVVKNADATMVGPFCHPVTSCLLLEQTPCGTGEGCYLTANGPECALVGSKLPGEACASANDCVRGSSCLLVGGVGQCSFHCSTTGGTPACAATGTGGTSCMATSGTPPEANFGVCR